MTDYRTILQGIFSHALDAVKTDRAVQRHLLRDGETLRIGADEYDLRKYKSVQVVGGGKGAAPMAAALEELLGDKITGGDVVVKDAHTLPLKTITLWEAAHPVPDQRGVDAAQVILRRLHQCSKDDLVINCITGGSSALLISPAGKLTLVHKQRLSEVLLQCGATIHEINTIRKHVSAIKGGWLAQAANPAKVLSLIVSDVIGDDLSVIGSGPGVPDPSRFEDCLRMIDSYGISEELPVEIMDHLKRGRAGEIAETPKGKDGRFVNASNHLIATNELALAAMHKAAQEAGAEVEIISSRMEGEAREVAVKLAEIAKNRATSRARAKRPLWLLAGGETTVTLNGNGKGGRNQEMALAMAIELEGTRGIHALCAGTDGSDGPTDAAGAFAHGDTLSIADRKGLSAREYLANNDSYSFFEQIDDLFITGPTLTNVMDLIIVSIQPEST